MSSCRKAKTEAALKSCPGCSFRENTTDVLYSWLLEGGCSKKWLHLSLASSIVGKAKHGHKSLTWWTHNQESAALQHWQRMAEQTYLHPRIPCQYQESCNVVLIVLNPSVKSTQAIQLPCSSACYCCNIPARHSLNTSIISQICSPKGLTLYRNTSSCRWQSCSSLAIALFCSWVKFI